MGKPAAPLTLVALAALAFTLGGCGGDDDGGDEVGGTDTAAEEATTTEDPREALEAEIVAAYEASWT
ncbi:MAG: carbohydrate ABC transporter substrate-binding protein, partial [Acidimicrobiales bacterium]